MIDILLEPWGEMILLFSLPSCVCLKISFSEREQA